jgi:hypothetical protein
METFLKMKKYFKLGIKKKHVMYSMVRSMLFRARFNTQRHYEFYDVDCSE